MQIYRRAIPEKRAAAGPASSDAKQSSRPPAHQFEDNRPQALVQRKLQELANRHAAVASRGQIQRLVSVRTPHPVVQLTTYKLAKTGWGLYKTSNADNDIFPKPTDTSKPIGTTFDCETGKYTDPSGAESRLKLPATKIVSNIGDSSGNLGHSRSRTAYGYLNTKGKRDQNGPHVNAHVLHAVAHRASDVQGFDVGDLLGSRLAPKPRQVANKVKKGLINKSRLNKKTKRQAKAYLEHYKRQYYIVKDKTGKYSKEQRNKAGRRLVELNPNVTYAWDMGSYTKSQIKGKGEKRKRASDDLSRMHKLRKKRKFNPKKRKFDKNFKTVDTLGFNNAKDEETAFKMMGAFSDYAFGYELSEDSSSETDEEFT